MFLRQRVQNAIVPSRILGPKPVARAFGGIVVLALARHCQGNCGLRATIVKKFLGNGWSMKSLQSTIQN